MLDKTPERNKPLVINIRVFDVETDKEECKTTFNIRKVDIDMRKFKTYKLAEEEYKKQSEGLDKKYQAIMNLVIWAMNNGKEVTFTNVKDDND